ncbi:MAG: hypothetical protein ACYTGZ_13040, partial [Planctomycetota bacterium]
ARDDSWARSTGQKANAQATARTAKAAGRKNNVFVGRDGKVYKHTQQGWNVRSKSGWQKPGQAKPGTKPGARPKTQPKKTSRADVNQNLQRQHTNRTRGSYRSNQYRRSQPRRSYRSSGRSRGGGGARGGGGRRR